MTENTAPKTVGSNTLDSRGQALVNEFMRFEKKYNNHDGLGYNSHSFEFPTGPVN